MLFPQTDRYWTETIAFVRNQIKDGERLLAPKEFKEVFSNVYPYAASYSLEEDGFEWALIHKGRMKEIDYVLLKTIIKAFITVYANEVFVILTNRQDVPVENSKHVQSFYTQFQEIDRNTYTITSNQSVTGKLITSIKDFVSMPRIEVETICRNNFQTTYLGSETILCRVLGKYLFYADSQDFGITPHLCMNGYWELWITTVMIRTLQPGWQCIDVGANHGYYSVVMADIVGSEGCVIAIEPNPRLASLLEQTIDVNGLQKQTTVLQKAVSRSDSKIVRLVIPKGRGMNASVQDTKLPWYQRKANEIVKVKTVTLDSLTQNWSRVDFVKIDAEGAEEEIWRGMRDTLMRNKDIVVVMEFNCGRYAEPKTFLQDIQAAGFPLKYIDYDAEIKDLTVERCLSERRGEDWMLFLKRE